MAWRLSDSLDVFLDAAGDHLRSDPVRHTVPLTVLETLRLGGMSAFGDSPPIFGWHEPDDGPADGAVVQTPPFPLLLASLPAGSAASLLDLLAAAGTSPGALNVAGQDEASFLAAWTAAGGGSGTAQLRTRLFRLGVLVPPEPAPPGAARVAGQADRDLLIEWHLAFGRETHGVVLEDAERSVTDRLSHHGLMLWEAGGAPVAMAGLTREVAGVVRVGAVYTPPGHRRRGYGGAVTAAVSQAARDAGAAEVVLFTDLANPTSNALYRRLGYQPVEDRVVLDLSASNLGQPAVTGGHGASSSVS
jgi:GNAT superfamily N-acetyltransferase